jgi:hypothetical protein
MIDLACEVLTLHIQRAFRKALQHLHALVTLFTIGDNLAKRRACTPDAPPQASKLYDLGMVHKQIRVRALVLNVIGEYVRVCSFEPTEHVNRI